MRGIIHITRIEEVACRRGLTGAEPLLGFGRVHSRTACGRHLVSLAENELGRA